MRGRELVRRTEFNEKVGESALLTGSLSDGCPASMKSRRGQTNCSESQSTRRGLRANGRRCTAAPQIGHQADTLAGLERGEAVIVYDPAMEYLRQFKKRAGDMILNPMDARCPS